MVILAFNVPTEIYRRLQQEASRNVRDGKPEIDIAKVARKHLFKGMEVNGAKPLQLENDIDRMGYPIDA